MPEDTTVLPQALATGFDEYTGKFGNQSASQMIQEYGGSKSQMAQKLAGTTDKSSSAYNSQMKNIRRWLAYESGERGKQARSAQKSKVTQERFRAKMSQLHPPTKVNVVIRGRICVSNDCRDRTVGDKTPITANAGKVRDLINQGDVHGAYQELLASYFGRSGGTVKEAYNIGATFS